MREQRVQTTAENKRSSYLLRLYGITVERYEELLEQQGGTCAICGEENQRGFRLAVDHCHDTGEVRGLLCQMCNMAIGNLRERLDLLDAACTYLRHFKDEHVQQ